MTDPTPGTDLEPGIAAGFGDDLEPTARRHLAAMHKEARQLALTAVVPKSITHTRVKEGDKWKDVERPQGEIVATLFAVVRYGELFGFPPAVALSKVDVIEGRLEPRYDALLGIAMDQGHQFRWGECDATEANLRVRRREDHDDPEGWQPFRFTMEDAVLANLAPGATPSDWWTEYRTKAFASSGWAKYPTDMLRSKVAKRAVRLATPDVLVDSSHGAYLIEGAPLDSFAKDDEVVDGEPV